MVPMKKSFTHLYVCMHVLSEEELAIFCPELSLFGGIIASDSMIFKLLL